MRKKHKKLTACAVAAMLGLSCMFCPVHAEEAQFDGQTDTGGLLELDETAVPVETEQETKPTLETNKTVIGPEEQAEKNAANNAGAFNVVGGTQGVDWNFAVSSTYSAINITASGQYTVIGNDTSLQKYQLNISQGVTCTITLNNVNMESPFAGMNIGSNSNVTLELIGDNSFIAGNIYNAGIEFNNGTGNLVIDSEKNGTLYAKGIERGAGIGGGDQSSGNNITINGGSVTATSVKGAGIGGGYAKGASNIKITGGTVTATSTGGGAGIGGGYGGGASNIKITGGSVKAGSIGTTPTDGNGNNVYLAKLETMGDVNEVTVDSGKDNAKTFTRAGSHSDIDTAFYLYLTGENHVLQIGSNYYKALYKDGNFTTQLIQKPDKPKVEIDTSKTTASSITVNALANQETYGTAEYSIDNREWQDSNVFENLHSKEYGGNQYTVYARYKGNDNYVQSDAGIISNVSTNPATYVITIPQKVYADGTEHKIEASKTDSFDLGFRGKVDVVLKNDTGEQSLSLYLENSKPSSSTILPITAMINGHLMKPTDEVIATFRSQTDVGGTVLLQQPNPSSSLSAGKYKGVLNFYIRYSEEN